MSLVSGPGRGGVIEGQLPSELRLYVDKHVTYIQSLDKRKDELEYWLTEHLRLSGLYWGLTALHLLGQPDALPRSEVLDFVISCLQGDGGFAAAPQHDSHMLYTVSGVQILAMLDALDEFDERVSGGREKVARFIANLQHPKTGTFAGDIWGETDTRFLYGALNALSLLGMTNLVDVDKAVEHVQACANSDGGYGTNPGAESHAGQVFTCVGALAIAGRLDLVDRDKLGGWLSERQLSNGGLNGRPEKLEDVCYSWWVVSSLAMIDRLHWISGSKLQEFILKCQDPDHGGISDRPGDMVDVFHTVFGIAGLSLTKYPGLVEVDPIYKGHLSHYYKIKVRSGNEDNSRKLIEDYDRWYAEWNVEDLMSERMNLKEKRRTRPRASASGRASTATTSRTRPRALGPIDPRLSVDTIKTEPRPTPPLSSVDPASLHASSVPPPPMAYWPPPQHAVYSSCYPRRDSGYSEYFPPTRQKKAVKAEPAPAPTRLDGDNNSDDFQVSESTKLKGIFWPGMDIFDSATPEMRRKRNQKKDVSVVEQLEVNSQEVEPTEMVFTPLGSLKKQRKISGLPDEDSSPLKLDPSPARPYLSRTAFAELDANNPRRLNFFKAKPSFQEFRHTTAFEDDLVEHRLTYGGNFGTKRKCAFDIFKDQDDDQGQDQDHGYDHSHEISFEHPASLNLLNSEFRPPPQFHQSPSFDFKPFDDPFQSFRGDADLDAAAYQLPAYYNVPTHALPIHAAPSRLFSNQAFESMAGHDIHGLFPNSVFPYTSHLDEEQAQVDEEDIDDGRTLTAPPSEV